MKARQRLAEPTAEVALKVSRIMTRITTYIGVCYVNDIWGKIAYKPCHGSQVAKIRASEKDQLKFSIDDGSQVFRMRAETMYAPDTLP